MLYPCFKYYFFNLNFPGVTWSLAVEWHIYLLFPLLLWAWRKFGPEISLILTGMITLPISDRLFKTNCHQACSPQYLFLFFFGMYAAHLAYSQKANLRKIVDRIPWITCTIITGAIFVYLLKVNWPILHNAYTFYDALFGVVAFCWIMDVSVRSSGLLAKVLGCKPFALIGACSYSLYLIHVPLLRAFWYCICLKLPQALHTKMLCFIGMPLIIGFSYLLYLVAEKPFLRIRDLDTNILRSQFQRGSDRILDVMKPAVIYLKSTDISSIWKRS